MSATASAAPRRPFSKQDFYRYCRLIHGWLSAFAFLILCFFAITGLILNHPDWPLGDAPPAIEKKFTLEPQELQQLNDAEEPETLLVEFTNKRVDLKGEISGGNQAGNEIFVRMQGVRGLSDVRASLITGNVEAIVEPAPPLAIFNELHRGERAGTSWRWVIDAVAILLVVLSIVGYLIFLSLRFRLRTALLLTLASGIGLWSLFAFAVA